VLLAGLPRPLESYRSQCFVEVGHSLRPEFAERRGTQTSDVRRSRARTECRAGNPNTVR